MKTGFLNKKGHSMLKSIKSRWFALKPDSLTYYVSSGYREKKGELIVNNEAAVTSLPDKGSYKYRFVVTCGQTKRDFELTAPDLRTKQAWIAAVQTAIGRCSVIGYQIIVSDLEGLVHKPQPTMFRMTFTCWVHLIPGENPTT